MLYLHLKGCIKILGSYFNYIVVYKYYLVFGTTVLVHSILVLK